MRTTHSVRWGVHAAIAAAGLTTMALQAQTPAPQPGGVQITGTSTVMDAKDLSVARRRFEAGTVQHRQPAAHVADQTGPLQGRRCHADAAAALAEHLPEELLRQHEFVAADAVVRHQQPARTALLRGVDAVARGVLRDLGEERLRVAVQHASEGVVRARDLMEPCRRHAKASPATWQKA